MNDVDLLWQWLGVSTLLIIGFAILVVRLPWRDRPTSHSGWVGDLLSKDDSKH